MYICINSGMALKATLTEFDTSVREIFNKIRRNEAKNVSAVQTSYDKIDKKIIQIGKELRKINKKMQEEEEQGHFSFSNMNDNLIINVTNLPEGNEVKYEYVDSKIGSIIKIYEKGNTEAQNIMNETDRINKELLHFYRIINEYVQSSIMDTAYIKDLKDELIPAMVSNIQNMEKNIDKYNKYTNVLKDIYYEMNRIISQNENVIELFNTNYPKYSNYYMLASRFAFSMMDIEKKVMIDFNAHSDEKNNDEYVFFNKYQKNNKRVYDPMSHEYKLLGSNNVKSIEIFNTFSKKSASYEHIEKQIKKIELIEDLKEKDELQNKFMQNVNDGKINSANDIKNFIVSEPNIHSITKRNIAQTYLEYSNTMDKEFLILQCLRELKYVPIDTYFKEYIKKTSSYTENLALSIILFYICNDYKNENDYGPTPQIDRITSMLRNLSKNYNLFYIEYDLKNKSIGSVARYNIIYNVAMIYYCVIIWDLAMTYSLNIQDRIFIGVYKIDFHKNIVNKHKAFLEQKNDYPTSNEIAQLFINIKDYISDVTNFNTIYPTIDYAPRSELKSEHIIHIVARSQKIIELTSDYIKYFDKQHYFKIPNDINDKIYIANTISNFQINATDENIRFKPNPLLEYAPSYIGEYINLGRMLLNLTGSLIEKKILGTEFTGNTIYDGIDPQFATDINNPSKFFVDRIKFDEIKKNSMVLQILKEIYEKSNSLASLILNIKEFVFSELKTGALENKEKEDAATFFLENIISGLEYFYRDNDLKLNRFMIPDKFDDLFVDNKQIETFFEKNHEVKLIFENNKACKFKKQNTFQYDKTLLGEHKKFLSEKIILHDKVSNISRLYFTSNQANTSKKIHMSDALFDEQLIKPNFDLIDREFQFGGNYKSVQRGGHKSLLDQPTKNIIDEFNKFTKRHKEYIFNFNIEAEKVNQLYEAWMYHYIFLNKINSDKLINKGNVIYEYFNMGVIIYYSKVLASLITKMNSFTPRSEIKYFKKEHYVTIKLLEKFFRELLKSTKESFNSIMDNCKFNEMLVKEIKKIIFTTPLKDEGKTNEGDDFANIDDALGKITFEVESKLLDIPGNFDNNIQTHFVMDNTDSYLHPIRLYNPISDPNTFYSRIRYSYTKELLKLLNDASKNNDSKLFHSIINLNSDFKIECIPNNVHMPKADDYIDLAKDLVKFDNIKKFAVNKSNEFKCYFPGMCENTYKRNYLRLYSIWDAINKILKSISDDSRESKSIDDLIHTYYRGVTVKTFYDAVLEIKDIINNNSIFFNNDEHYIPAINPTIERPTKIAHFDDIGLPRNQYKNMSIVLPSIFMSAEINSHYDTFGNEIMLPPELSKRPFIEIMDILKKILDILIKDIIRGIYNKKKNLQNDPDPKTSRDTRTREVNYEIGDITIINNIENKFNVIVNSLLGGNIKLRDDAIYIALLLYLYELNDNYDTRKYYFPTFIMNDCIIFRLIQNIFMVPYSIFTEIGKIPEHIIEKVIISNSPLKNIKLLTTSTKKVITDIDDNKLNKLLMNRTKDRESPYVSQLKELLIHVNYVYKYYVYALPLYNSLSEFNAAGQYIANINRSLGQVSMTIDGIRKTILPYSQQVIDVDGCGPNAKKYFIMFNSFKNILDQYDVSIKGEISIIARINDGVLRKIEDINNSTEKRAFVVSNVDDTSYLFVNHGKVDMTTRYDALEKETRDIIKKNENDSLRERIKKEHTNDEDKGDNGLLSVSDNGEPFKKIGNYDIDNYSIIKFSDVVDSKSIESNVVLEKYLGIAGKLNQGTSVMIPTLGYSGTGKSFTLFGKYIKNDPLPPTIMEGVLHAVIQNLDGLKSCQFRMYELYGKGVPYFFYFGKPVNEIDHKILAYKLKFDKKIMMNVPAGENPRVEISAKYIDDYCSREPGRRKTTNSSSSSYNDLDYVEIKSHEINHFVNTFASFVDEVDDIRRTKPPNTISVTPNNPESSRSILIYDFLFSIKNFEVSFVIVDLPGREELIQTYGENYLNLYGKIMDTAYGIDTTTKRQELILKALSVNPLYLCLLVPGLVIKSFNAYVEHKEKKDIYEKTETNVFYTNTYMYNPLLAVDQAENFVKFLKSTGYNLTLPHYTKIFNEHKNDEVKYEIKREEIKVGTETKIIYHINTETKSNFFGEIFDISKEGKLRTMDEIARIENDDIKVRELSISPTNNSLIMLTERYVVTALHIINRVVKQNKFIILENICMAIADEYANKHVKNGLTRILADGNKMREIMNYFNTERPDFVENKKDTMFKRDTRSPGKTLTELVDPTTPTNTPEYKSGFTGFYNQYCVWTYRSTPWEGVYINENIMGLLNYFILEKINKSSVLEKIEKQHDQLIFHIEKAMMQLLTWEYYKKPDSTKPNTTLIDLNDVFHTGITGQIKVIHSDAEFKFWGKNFKIEQNLQDEYKSDRIFKKNTGLPDETTLIEKMLKPYFKSDRQYQYCIFYLMANQPNKFKPQINLLMKSQNIVENIVG